MNCEKILHKICKIFQQVYFIKKNSGIEGHFQNVIQEGVDIELADFNFKMSGNN